MVPQHGPNFDGMPPVRYQGEWMYDHTIYTMEINKYCGKADPGWMTIACITYTKDGTPYKVMPDPCVLGDVDFYARVECHENAHLRGWGGNHEL